jgi:PAS domain S-box-containing protein
MQGPDFQRIFEALPSAHMVLDRNLNYVAANQAYQRSVLRSMAELEGRNIFDLFPNEGEGGRRLRSSFDRVLETGKPDTLAYIPYDIPRPDDQGGGFEVRYWTASHAPVLDARGRVAYIIQNTVDVTDLVRLREAAVLPFPARSGALVEKAREAEEAHRQLIAESDEFRRLFKQAPGFMAVLSGADHVFAFANDAYVRLIGGRDVQGLRLREALPEIESQGFIEILDEVYRTGTPHSATGALVKLESGGGGGLREAFVDFSYAPIRDRSGTITGIFVQGMDRTEGVRAERTQRLLLDEVNHRVKNTLATVQSIASQTLKGANDLDAARRDFEGRIIALSRTHNLLSDTQWSNASLATLVQGELATFGPKRVVVGGPEIVLNPKASIALSMTLHELATNAVRHGALAGGEGIVAVTWQELPVSGDLEIEWREHNPVPVEHTERLGLGTRMIRRLIEGELAGRYETGPDMAGFACTIRIPAETYRGSVHADT